MRGPIIAVAAFKGGVGKTTLAYELAAVLDGVLVDLDFQGGGATHVWGLDPESLARSPLLDALEQPERVPRPKRRPSRPDLVPCHPDLAVARLDDDDVADALERWATAWQRCVVVDTHPGRHWASDGAVKVADLVVVPVPPGRAELGATRGLLRELAGFPVMLVPYMTPTVPDARWIEAFTEFDQSPTVSIASPISEYRWLRRRVLASALTRQKNPGVRVRRAADEFNVVANQVANRCRQNSRPQSQSSTLAARA
jgi:chromosome partitioning protein